MITSKKYSEPKIVEVNQELIMNHPMAILVVNPNGGRILDANLAASRFYGWSVGKLQKMNISDLNTMSPQNNSFEFQHRLADGQVRDVEVNSIPILWGQRNVLCSMINDVTKRKQTGNAMLRSAEIQTALREIAEIAARASSLAELYQAVHLQVGRIFPSDYFNISLLNEADGQIMTPYCADKTGAIPRRRLTGRYMTEYTIRQQRAIHVTANEFEQLRQAGEVDSRFVQFKEWMGAPLRDAKGCIFGVASLISLEDGQAFQPEDVKFLSIIAAQIAMAIDRKRTEDALRESEERLREVLENSLNAAYKRNLQTNAYEYLSPVFFQMVGYTPNELKKSPFEFIRNLVHPDDLAEADRVFTESKFGDFGKVFHMEYRLKHKKGQYRWIHDQFTLMRHANGETRTCIGSIIDITERKRTEDALRRSGERFRQLVQKNPVPLSCISKSGTISYVNERFVQTFGYTSDDIPTLREWWSSAYPDENYRRGRIKSWEAAIKRATREKKDIEPTECRTTCKDGSVRIVIITGIIMEDGFLATYTDITDRRRNERLLIASYERKKKNELLNELIRANLPSKQALSACTRMLGKLAMESFDCYLVVMNSFRGKPREFWLENREVYQPLVDLLVDALDYDSSIAWESSDGLGVLCFGEPSSVTGKAQQIIQAEEVLHSIALQEPEIDVSIGIAERAANLTEIGSKYRQALISVHSGRKIWRQRKIYHYLDLGLLQLLPYVNNQQQIKDYIERTLGKLLQQDANKKRKLLETLESILLSNNLKESAGRLSIHYKTLIFRKRRLEDILGVSLDDSDSRIALASAIQLMKLYSEEE